MSASARLAELGIALPAVAKPVAAYVPAARVGNQIWTSGQLPSVDGVLTATGKLGAGVTIELRFDCPVHPCSTPPPSTPRS